MALAQDGDVILDTSIYYKNADRVSDWLSKQGFRPHFTPNNALELITPEPEQSSDKFQKRQQAIRNLLQLTNDGTVALPDSELVHANLLGMRIDDEPYWPEACKRFVTMPDASEASWVNAKLNLQPAIDAIEAAYGAFIEKVKEYQNMFDLQWKANKEDWKSKGITYEMFRDSNRLKRLIADMGAIDNIAAAHVDRIALLAKEMEAQGALIPVAKRFQAIKYYCQAYAGYVRYSLSTNKRDKNDFGDLQFFAYCDAGFKLISSEGRWKAISEDEEMSHLFIHYI